MCRGKNYDVKTLAIFDNAKMMDLTAEMEINSQKLLQQESMLKGLRRKIQKHIHEKGCSDIHFEEELNSLLMQENYGSMNMTDEEEL
jgi:hypothetical protein